jgi:predicted O-linked N-acetylglucosamine transferase (SPINDLY family)
VFATTGPDKERFLREAMRGVDWRKDVEGSVEYFHDVSKMDVSQQAALIRKLGIHILLDWDGYSNNGVRAAGLFPQQTAPIQIVHQVSLSE